MPKLPRVVTRPPADGWLLLEPEDCPLRAQHTPRPNPSPLAFDDWATKLAKTRKQMRCEGCHRYSVWVPYGADVLINGVEFTLAAAPSEGDSNG